jgi:hypothetical protein
MARYRVIYWQHIPTMVVAADSSGEVRRALPPRFQAAVDAFAMSTGQTEDEVYSAGWRRGDWQEREGGAQAVAEAVAAELEAAFPLAALRPPAGPSPHA